MQGHNCSFIIKHCKDIHVMHVQHMITTFCNSTENCNLINIISHPNLFVIEDECAIIMYVNLYNFSDRASLMNYIRNDINDELSMQMICKEQGKTDSVQFTLLVNSFEFPDMDEIINHFEKFGNCEISNYSWKDSVKTFVNYYNFENAKKAYLETKIHGLKIGSIVTYPLPIKYTRMLLALETQLSKRKSSIIAEGYIGFDYVENFLHTYSNHVKYDMSKENNNKLTEACSRFVETFFNWSFNSENKFFSSGEDGYTHDIGAWEVLETAKKDSDSITAPVILDVDVIKTTITMPEHTNKHRDVEPVVLTCRNVRKSIFELMNEDLAVLEINLFGISSEGKNNPKDRIANIEDFLNLSSQGLDVQERLIKIKEKVVDLSTYYKNEK